MNLRNFLDWYVEPGEVHELTWKNEKSEWWSEQFQEMEALAESAINLGKIHNTYMSLHPVEDVKADFNPRRQRIRKHDVKRRAGILLDIDVRKPSGTAATLQQYEACQEFGQRLIDELIGFENPALIGSGNGCYVLWKTDMPPDERCTEMVRQLMIKLDQENSTNEFLIDRTPFDLTRIFRLPETTNFKEPDPAKRRQAEVLHLPRGA